MSQYNNIKITPYVGVSSDPVIEFTGAGNSTLTLRVLDDAAGGITFEGSQGEILSLIDTDISIGSSVPYFSIQDFYGIPQIEAYSNNTLLLAPKIGYAVGIGTTNPTEKLDVVGNAVVSGNLGIGTINPISKLDVRGDLRVGINTSQGLILTSPNGTTFRLVVDDSGTLSAISTTL